MEAAERQKLEDEIRAKQEEVSRIQQEVELKDSETRRLQEEVEDARRKQDEAAAALLAATTPQHHHVAERADTDPDHDNASDAGSESGGGDLARGPDDLVDPVADRRTLAERNERLHNQLKVRATTLFYISISLYDAILTSLVSAGAEARLGAVLRRNQGDRDGQDPPRERPPGT